MRSSLKFKLALSALLAPQYILVRILSQQPDWVEAVYSRGVYPLINNVQSFIFSKLPFSVGDVLYLLIGLTTMVWLYLSWRSSKNKYGMLLLNALAWMATVHFFFYALWGLNYYRTPLHEKLNYDTTYDEATLACVVEELIVSANALHAQLTPDPTLKVSSPYSKKELMQEIVVQYAFEMGGETVQPYLKTSLWSLPLTYMGYAGYLNPFTLESQVNNRLPTLSFVPTAAHEMAHQLGYASESEANFIAFVTTVQHSDPYIRYAGYTFALRYCYNDLYRKNPEQAAVLLKNLRSGVLENFRELQSFWEQYRNPLEPLFKKSYDAYLKAND